MRVEKMFRGLVAMFAGVIVSCLALGLAGCSGGELGVATDDGAISITASSDITGTALTSIQVGEDEDVIEVVSEIEEGTITIAFNDGSSGRLVLDSNSTRHETVSVDPGTCTVTILAEHATGQVGIRTAMVLDGDGTAGS